MQTAEMLYVDVDRCSGCGVCVDLCPSGATSVQDGKASINQALCNQCEACFDACPEEAILSVAERSLVPEEEPVGAVTDRLQGQPQCLAVRAAPALAATLLFIGRELVPRAANYVLDIVDRRVVDSSSRGLGDVTRSSEQSRGSASGGRRRRRRRGG